MRKRDAIPVYFPNELFWRNGLIPVEADPFGSYTGVPKEFDGLPVQDADDL